MAKFSAEDFLARVQFTKDETEWTDREKERAAKLRAATNGKLEQTDSKGLSRFYKAPEIKPFEKERPIPPFRPLNIPAILERARNSAN